MLKDEAVDTLVLDLLEWVASQDRSYAEVMDAWRTTCPKFPIWEDATDQRLLITERNGDGSFVVRLTAAGGELLERRRPSRPA
jgi:D-3-phosphoglycerate dehydrogenase